MPYPMSTQSSVLVVEDDPQDRETLRKSFEGLSVDVHEATGLESALELVASLSPSLVLSEVVLPDGSGFSLCRRLRASAANATIPIVLVSRWSTESDRILAFECGADDFLAKPFFTRELASRVRAVLRRSRHGEPARALREPAIDEDFRLRSQSNEVEIGDQRIALTPKEYAVLEALLEHRGRVLGREELIERVWSHGAAPGERSVDAHVKSLRRKLGLPPSTIETVRGRGYRFTLDCQRASNQQ